METEKKIMIIENDKDLAELIKYNLEKMGLQVIEAENGEKGLDLARTHNPDLIILDLMLPKIDGFEVLKILKEDKSISEIPVMILSAKVSPSAIIKGFHSGALDYIPKPFSVGELVLKIKNILEKGREVK